MSAEINLLPEAFLQFAATGLAFPEFHPALVTLPKVGPLGPFPLRWYALAYIFGLLLAWRYAVALVKRPQLFGDTDLPKVDDIDELLFWATLGVILGGRLGYILFYQLPFEGERFAQDPLMVLRVWEGGMSFHGGLIGVAIAMVWVARSRGLKLLQIADIAACATPIGLFLGRLANFINAELYGRATSAPVGIVFPQGDCRHVPPGTECSTGAPGSFNWATGEWIYSGQEVARHPSQLYEATLEGLLLFVVLALLTWRFGLLRHAGLATGIFLIGYGIGRSVAEMFREPDAHINFLFGDWLTMGMLLSFFMWTGGAYLIWRSRQSGQPKLT